MSGTRPNKKLWITFWARFISLHTGAMHIEDIFEVLEAQFEAARKLHNRDTFTTNARAMKVATSFQPSKELFAPILGLEFIAGIDPDAPTWHIFPMRSVCGVNFYSEVSSELPELRNLIIDLADFIECIPRPCSIRWRTDSPGGYLHSGVLHSVTNSLMFVFSPGAKRPTAIPITSLTHLIIESVDNLNSDF
jgi:hypothetical protein